MQQPLPPPSKSSAGAACCGGGEVEDPFFDDYDDIVIPPDLVLELDHEDGAAVEDAQTGGRSGGEEDDERLSLVYKGFSYVFDSVPPEKVVTILSLLNGLDMAQPQTQTTSRRPQLTHLVRPIVVPRDFDRTAAVSRYRAKRKATLRFDVKADYSVRREIASRIARRRGKFVSSSDEKPALQLQATTLPLPPPPLHARREQGEKRRRRPSSQCEIVTEY